MTAAKAQHYLLDLLKHYGAIKWHSNANSAYVKFRDERLGSVRLSDHDSRSRYTYRYEVDLGQFAEEQMDIIAEKISKAASGLYGFDASIYRVFNKDSRQYDIVPTIEDYTERVLMRNK